MSNSREMRRLHAKWQQNTGWPKRLEWIEIDGLKGVGRSAPLLWLPYHGDRRRKRFRKEHNSAMRGIDLPAHRKFSYR